MATAPSCSRSRPGSSKYAAGMSRGLRRGSPKYAGGVRRGLRGRLAPNRCVSGYRRKRRRGGRTARDAVKRCIDAASCVSCAPNERRSGRRCPRPPKRSGSRSGSAGAAASKAGASLRDGDPGQQDHGADRLVEVQWLAQHDDSEDRREHWDQVGDRRGHRRAGGADDRVVEHIGDAAAEDAERQQAPDRARRKVGGRGTGERSRERQILTLTLESARDHRSAHGTGNTPSNNAPSKGGSREQH
jgi:hypothetical protein